MSKKSFFWPVLSDEEKKQTEKPKPARVLATSQSGVGMDMGAEFAQAHGAGHAQLNGWLHGGDRCCDPGVDAGSLSGE